MQVKSKVVKTYLIELDEQAARIFRAMLQNPIGTDNPNMEDKDVKGLREQLFNAVRGAVVIERGN